MRTDYNYDKYNYMYPMTVEVNGDEYYVERLERSLDQSSYWEDVKERIRIDAFKPFGGHIPSTKCLEIAPCKVIFNGPATIVFWKDSTKTIVKCAEGDKNDPKVGLLYAIAKKKFGNNSRIHKEIDKFVSSNAQRIAILKYIVAKDGFDIDKIYEQFKN